MRYLDSIVDALMEVHIFEMAFQRKVIVNKIRDLSLHISEHICKIALWPDHSARKHWEKEVNAGLENISRLRYDGTKRLKVDEYFNLLYKEPFDRADLTKFVAEINIRKYGIFNLKWTDSEFGQIEKKIKSVYTELSKQMSTNNYTYISDTLRENGI